MYDPSSQHCHLQPNTMPPVSNTLPKALNKDLTQTMTVTNKKRRKKEEQVAAATKTIQWNNNNNNNSSSSSIHMCTAIHIIYNQNQTKCTLPTSTAGVRSRIFQHLWLPTCVHKLRLTLVYTHTNTKLNIQLVVYMYVGNSDTRLPSINLTGQYQWVTFCLVYLGWQQTHELVTV
jgi:hypothetical protein